MASWFVIGVSGVSCAGKTSLSLNLKDFLLHGQFSDTKWNTDPRVIELRRRVGNCHFRIGNVELLHQDDYFLPEQYQEDVDVLGLPRKNWELISGLDMKRMCMDVEKVLIREGKVTVTDDANVINILILEGFTIFSNSFIQDLCNLKVHLHLPYEHCYERRKHRVYDPPDEVGYFELCVWPEYERYFRDRIKDRKDIRLLNGKLPKIELNTFAMNLIGNAFKF